MIFAPAGAAGLLLFVRAQGRAFGVADGTDADDARGGPPVCMRFADGGRFAGRQHGAGILAARRIKTRDGGKGRAYTAAHSGAGFHVRHVASRLHFA